MMAEQMFRTSTRKAGKFAKQVLGSVSTKVTNASIKQSSWGHRLLPVMAKDEMVHMAKKLFSLQEEFRRAGIDPHVDICYHYTNEKCMFNVQQSGLLSTNELRTTNQGRVVHGAFFGPGIYTCNNPFAFKHLGKVGE
jgi:hypothetical protein